MEGNVQNVVGYLKKGTKFVIPVYQRNYNWTLENCQRLMEDLVELNNSGKIHISLGVLLLNLMPMLRKLL